MTLKNAYKTVERNTEQKKKSKFIFYYMSRENPRGKDITPPFVNEADFLNWLVNLDFVSIDFEEVKTE